MTTKHAALCRASLAIFRSLHQWGLYHLDSFFSAPAHSWFVCLVSICLVSSWAPAAASPVYFDHQEHEKAAHGKKKSWRCTQCHLDGEAGATIRPAHKNHQSCSDNGCHAQDFYGSNRKTRSMCTLCHVNDQPWADMRPLKSFPSKGEEQRTYCIKFSHKQHLAKGVIGRTDCNRCHKLAADKVTYIPPNHGDCVDCHTADHSVPMSSCDGCHEMGSANGALLQCSPTVPWRSRQIATRFSHETHRIDIRKKGHPQMSCSQCHRSVHRSTSVRKIRLLYGFGMMKSSCGRCHNGSTRVPNQKRRVFSTSSEHHCGKCHGNKFSSMGAPKGH